MARSALEDALSEESMEETLTGLQRYIWEDNNGDAVDRITEGIADQFWMTIAGLEDPSEEYVTYDSLEQGTKDQVGYTPDSEEVDEEDRLPWWFRSFEWEFRMTNRGAIRVGDEEGGLNRLTEFDPEKTEIYKPVFNGGSDREDLASLIEGLATLRDELFKYVDVNDPNQLIDGDDEKPLPSELFELPSKGGSISSTEAFGEWLEGLLALCPPFNPTTTALLWYNTGLPEHAVEDLGVDPGVMRAAGLLDDEGLVQNEAYSDAFAGIMPFRGIFDQFVASGPDDAPLGHGLEAAYIDAWATNENSLTEREIEALRRSGENSKDPIDEDDQERLASCCLTLPIHYERRESSNATHVALAFDTQNRYPGGINPLSNYGIDQESRAKEILSTLKAVYELLPVADEDDE
jgi:hypothetical protein